MTAPALRQYVNGGSPASGDNLNTFMQTCDTFADLRTFIGTTGIKVFSSGATTDNDGGQGVFYWASGTLTDDGLNTIVPYGTASGGWVRQTGANNIMPVTVILNDVATYNVVLSDGLIVVRKNVAGVISIVLPVAPLTGETHTIKDGNAEAASYNITVSGNGFLIDGATTYVLNVAKQAVTVTFDGTGWDAW